MNTTRERQTRFIRDFPERVTREALHDLLARKRVDILDILPDDILAGLMTKMLDDERYRQRLIIRNRTLFQRRA